MVSVNTPVARFSTPANVRMPVAPARFPVPAETGPEALNAPLVTSNVPATFAVSVPCFAVNAMVPAIVKTGGAPLIANCPLVVPLRRPP